MTKCLFRRCFNFSRLWSMDYPRELCIFCTSIIRFTLCPHTAAYAHTHIHKCLEMTCNFHSLPFTLFTFYDLMANLIQLLTLIKLHNTIRQDMFRMKIMLLHKQETSRKERERERVRWENHRQSTMFLWLKWRPEQNKIKMLKRKPHRCAQPKKL